MTQVSRFLAKRQETAKELIERATDNLVKIGACFNTNLEDLPAEVRRDRNCFHSDKNLFALLDRHLRRNTLDAFLQKHTQCRELVAFIFGGRYPRLIQDLDLRLALAAADGTSPVDGQKFLANKRPRRQQQTAADGASWKPKRMRTEEGGACLPLTEQERRALQAFEDFQTADDDPLVPPSARGRFLVRAELEALEIKINGGHNENGKALLGTQFTFTLPPRSSSPAPRPAETDPSPAPDTSHEPLMSAIQASLAAEYGVDEGRLMEFKGHLLEPPWSLLSKLKAHLSTPDVEQDPQWASFSADIQDYLAYLLQVGAGESWEMQLDEVVDMFRAHTLYEDFHRDHPGLDHSLWDDVMKPRITLHDPLVLPAQMQYAPAQSVVLGTKSKAEEKEEEKDDDLYDKDPIVLDSMMLAEAPPKEARDPFAYTRWHSCLRANIEAAADEAREVTMARMKALKTKQEGFSVMDVPRNWSGPVSVDMLLDADACKMSSDWTRLRLLRTNLQRAARRSPRVLLEAVNTSVELGMAFKKDDAAQDSSPTTADTVLVRLQKEELDWLSFLCQLSLNDTSAAWDMTTMCRDDWKLAVLRRRIRKMQRSLAPGSFGDGQGFGLRGFLALVNQDCDGPVKGHRFTMAELQDRIPQLTQLKVFRSEEVDGVQHIRCYPGDIHPEEALRWPGSKGPRRRFRIQQSRDEGEEDDDDLLTTAAPVPHVMPNMDHVRTAVDECLAEQDEIRRDAARTLAFFRRIAYRLGRTLKEVEAESRQHRRRLARDPARQAANISSLRTLMTQWTADTGRAAIPQCRDGRVLASYRDVVLAAEPEALADRPRGSDWEQETYCKELVRRNILREAAENKTMLWPVPVPRDSSTVDGEAGQDGRTVLRREAVWSFAHPSRRAPAPRFFDVNAWPLEVQSAETQAAVRGHGGEEDADAMVLD